MAGLWDKWESHDSSIIDSYTIITKSPIDELKSIHHRMPLILHKKEINKWINNENINVERFNSEKLTLNITPADWLY